MNIFAQREALGTEAYFSALNSGTLLGGVLPDPSGYDWRGGLEDLASAAREGIAQVYDDLQLHAGILRHIPRERRERLGELVDALSGLCALAGTDKGKAMECHSMLSLSGFVGLGRSMATDSELEQAAEVIHTGGSSGLYPRDRMHTIMEAALRGEWFAAGSDDAKQLFLREVKPGQTSDEFYADAWDFYNYRENPGEYCGSNGCEFCSDDYVAQLEGALFPGTLGSAFLQTDYAAQIRSELQDIVQQIEADVADAERENVFLTQESCDRLTEAVNNLNQCGISGNFHLVWQIGNLVQERSTLPTVEASMAFLSETIETNLAAAGLSRQALAELVASQSQEDTGQADSVYGVSLGISAAWGVAGSFTVFFVRDGYGNAGVGVTGGFGGGLGASVMGAKNLADALGPNFVNGGTKFEGCDTIWDVEGPGVAIGGTAWIFSGEVALGKDTMSTTFGLDNAGLGFHAVITGTKLLFTFHINEIFGR